MSRLARIQKACWPLAALFAGLGLATATGCGPFPQGDAGWSWPLHGLLLAAGLAAGIAAMLRGVEIDRQRWEIVDDPLLTSGEREYAHKEAERQRRSAGTAFLLPPVTLGYWLAYQFGGEGSGLSTFLFAVLPLLAFFTGIVWARRYEP